MPMPAPPSRIDGARLSRLAATATAASTASMKSTVCMVAVMRALRHSGASAEARSAQAEEPGIHTPQRCGLWIPGPLAALASRNDDSECLLRSHATLNQIRHRVHGQCQHRHVEEK